MIIYLYSERSALNLHTVKFWKFKLKILSLRGFCTLHLWSTFSCDLDFKWSYRFQVHFSSFCGNLAYRCVTPSEDPSSTNPTKCRLKWLNTTYSKVFLRHLHNVVVFLLQQSCVVVIIIKQILLISLEIVLINFHYIRNCLYLLSC